MRRTLATPNRSNHHPRDITGSLASFTQLTPHFPESIPHATFHRMSESTKKSSEKPQGQRSLSLCPCKSRETYAACCERFHLGQAKPETAEQLMRSRYSAYFFRLADYLVSTTHPDVREPNLKSKIEASIDQTNWRFLTILSSSKGGKDDKTGKVEFVAEYFEENQAHKLHERSRFKRFKGAWKYLDAKG
jgi:SEC-C motif-containing protein